MSSGAIEPSHRAHRGWLALASLAACWPLANIDGALGYYDNALHVAELRSLAAGTPIADLAGLGIDLGALHTPLYRVLALAVALGVPAVPLYLSMLPLALVMLGQVSFTLAARRGPPHLAFAVALLVVLSPAELRGVGAPLAGMWPFAMSSALVALHLDRLGRPLEARRSVALLGLSGGGALLLHAFAAYALAVATGIALVHALRRGDRARAIGLASAGALSLALAFPYLLALARASLAGEPSFFNPPLLPMALALLSSLPSLRDDGVSFVLGLLPALVLAALVLRGSGALVRARRAGEAIDLGAALAMGVTAVVFVLVLAVSGSEATLLGPLSPRLAQMARVGWPMIAMRALTTPPVPAPPRHPALLGGAAVVLAALLAIPLWLELDAATMSEARALGDHLRDLRPSGRVLVAASYDDGELPVPLAASQAVAAPMSEAGIAVVGAYYSSLPMRTRAWTSALAGRDGEPGELMGVVIDGAAAIDALLPGLDAAAVSDVVVHEPAMIEAFAARSDFEPTGRSGRHATFRRRAPVTWGSPSVVRTGPMTFDVELDRASDVALSLAFHPSLAASIRTIGQADDGRITLRDLPAGHHRVELRRTEPIAPWIVSLAALVVALSWCRRAG